MKKRFFEVKKYPNGKYPQNNDLRAGEAEGADI